MCTHQKYCPAPKYSPSCPAPASSSSELSSPATITAAAPPPSPAEAYAGGIGRPGGGGGRAPAGRCVGRKAAGGREKGLGERAARPVGRRAWSVWAGVTGWKWTCRSRGHVEVRGTEPQATAAKSESRRGAGN